MAGGAVRLGAGAALGGGLAAGIELHRREGRVIGRTAQRPAITGRRRSLAVLLPLIALGGLFLLREGIVRRQELRSAPGGALLLTLAAVAAAAALGTAAAGLARWRALGAPGVRAAAPGLVLRVALYAGLGALAAGSVGLAAGLTDDLRQLRMLFYSVLVLGLAAWAAFLLATPSRPLRRPGGAWRVLDVALMNVLILLVAAEAGVALLARWLPSRILWNEASARARIETFRGSPGDTYFGFPLNRGGYHDDEFFRAEPDDLVVAALADSFGFGFVPHAENFLTVAEASLAAALGSSYRRVAVHNLGVASIGMSEYAWLLENEALALDPRLVLLCVYVGNDIDGLRPVPRRYYALQTFRSYALAGRLLALARERRPEAPPPGRPAGGPGGRTVPVPGPMSEETYLEICLEHLRFLDARSPSIETRYRALLEALDGIHARLGERLLVVLIPDELQVDDALYAAVLARVDDPAAYQRDHPQRRITAPARRSGIAVLDLLPALREAQEGGRTYLPRDTHWNARGNRVAGEAIASRVLDLLGPRESG